MNLGFDLVERLSLNASFDVPCESIHSCAHASILHASLSLQLLARTFVYVLGNADMFINSICIKSDAHFNSDCMLFYILQDKCHLIGSYGVCFCTY